MSEQVEKQAKDVSMVNLGAWLGRHQAFAVIANRCSAADAECLKAIRDKGEYKELGLTWEEFCLKHAGITREYADQMIRCSEQYGENYRRMTEVVPMSPTTYKLIGSAVTDKGLELHGECIPLTRENSGKIAAAVKTLCKEARASKRPALITIGSVSKSLDKVVQSVLDIANEPGRRAEVIVMLEKAGTRISELTHAIRQKTVLVD
jgi:hypothetical protein